MPYKPKLRAQIPEWIFDLQEDEEDLFDVLTEAAVARIRASRAIRERGRHAPQVCISEFEVGERIFEAIRTGVVPRKKRLQKAAVALRKYTMAHQCARFLESDTSPRYAKDPSRRRASVSRRRVR